MTNTEYLMLFRSSEFFSFVFFIFQQRMKTEIYWIEIFDSNLFARHLWSRKNMSYIKYFIFVYHYWVIVLLWWFYHWFHLSWYWPVWSGSYFLSVVPLYRQLKKLSTYYVYVGSHGSSVCLINIGGWFLFHACQQQYNRTAALGAFFLLSLFARAKNETPCEKNAFDIWPSCMPQ